MKLMVHLYIYFVLKQSYYEALERRGWGIRKCPPPRGRCRSRLAVVVMRLSAPRHPIAGTAAAILYSEVIFWRFLVFLSRARGCWVCRYGQGAACAAGEDRRAGREVSDTPVWTNSQSWPVEACVFCHCAGHHIGSSPALTVACCGCCCRWCRSGVRTILPKVIVIVPWEDGRRSSIIED